jgi:hypothetical protein
LPRGRARLAIYRFRQGLQLFYSGDGGTYFVLFKREKRRLEIEDGALRSFDGGTYYHEIGEAGVDVSNYKEKCPITTRTMTRTTSFAWKTTRPPAQPP